MKTGDRVGAISRDEDGAIRLLGFGVFLGSPPMEFDTDDGKTVWIPEPLLILDNSETARGYECLWETEEIIRDYIKKLPVVYVDTASS